MTEAPKRTVTYIDGRRVVLDENGKPCRSCNSLLDFQFANSKMKPAGAKKDTKTQQAPSLDSIFSTAKKGAAGAAGAAVAASTAPLPADCPPDSEALGRSTWTFLHTMAANYPEKASFAEQAEMTSFLHIFSKFYPCWYCAGDLRTWMEEPPNRPKVSGREDLSLWMCSAHNNVNRKLGKPSFDCAEWKARWRDGWPDGRCD